MGDPWPLFKTEPPDRTSSYRNNGVVSSALSCAGWTILQTCQDNDRPKGIVFSKTFRYQMLRQSLIWNTAGIFLAVSSWLWVRKNIDFVRYQALYPIFPCWTIYHAGPRLNAGPPSG
jgi:hypothetical protein